MASLARAEALQKEFGNSHVAQQFVDLDEFETLTCLLEDGVNKERFRTRTLRPLRVPSADAQSLSTAHASGLCLLRGAVERRLGQWIITSVSLPPLHRKRHQ